jgi:multicomponent Na+:H+ antiporter subunit F
MNTEHIILPEWAAIAALTMLLVAMLLALYRLAKGPSLPDRIVALDLIATLTIGLTIVFAIYTNQVRYLEIAVIVALVMFIGTVAYATYLKKKYYD